MTDKIEQPTGSTLFHTEGASAVHRDQGAQLIGVDVEPRVVEEEDADGAGH